MSARLLVQHHDVALTPDHLELLGTRHMRDIGAVAGGVDQVAASARLPAGGRLSVKRARSLLSAAASSSCELAPQSLPPVRAHKRYAVGNPRSPARDGHFKRVNVTGRRAPQRACCVGAGTRFQLLRIRSGADNRQLGHAVGEPFWRSFSRVRGLPSLNPSTNRPGASGTVNPSSTGHVP